VRVTTPPPAQGTASGLRPAEGCHARSPAILRQRGLKVNKLIHFTASGTGTATDLPQLLLFWTAQIGEGTSVPNTVLLFIFLIALGYL